jgi:hypothetical protein
MDQRGLVAKTILHQLGGAPKLKAMIGANTFILGDSTLSFRLPGGGGFAENGINTVVITLLPSDTYKVAFYRRRGFQTALVSVFFDIYEDVLKSLVEEQLGLKLSL